MICFFALLLVFGGLEAQVFDALETPPWSARTSAFSTTLNNKIFLMGGFSNKSSLNDVYSYDGIAWKAVTSSSGWESRYDGGLTTFGSKLILAGGAVATSTEVKVFNDVWSSADGSSWQLLTSSASFTGRRAFGFATYSTKLWVVGGYELNPVTQATQTLNDVWSSTDGISWSLINVNSTWRPRSAMSVFPFNSKLYMVGGGHGANSVSSSVYMTTDGLEWTNVTAPWPARRYPGVAISDLRVWVTSGATLSDFLNDAWYSDDFGITWTLATAAAEWASRSGASVQTRDGTLYVAGGTGATTDFFQDQYELQNACCWVYRNRSRSDDDPTDPTGSRGSFPGWAVAFIVIILAAVLGGIGFVFVRRQRQTRLLQAQTKSSGSFSLEEETE